MSVTFESKIGGLDTIISQNFPKTEESECEYIVIICHGYGVNHKDLSPIGPYACKKLKKKFKFLFPNAPIALGGTDVAWWNLDLQGLSKRMAAGESQELSKEKPKGLDHAAELLFALIKTVKANSPNASLIMGGFSQGAMLTTHLSLSLEEQYTPKALVIWSGSLINSTEWQEHCNRNPKVKNIHVMQTHGTSDARLTFEAGQSLHKFLEDNGVKVSFTTFEGGHDLPDDIIDLFIAYLESI